MELLERTPLLDELERLLRRAAGGQGSLVFLGGEAGAGKTSVVSQFCRSAGRAAVVLEGACDALSTPRPLGPVLDMAHLLAGDLDRLPQQAPPRGQVFRAFLSGVTSAAAPTLVVFEDVHWADEATLDLVRYLGRRLAAARTLLLATYRDDELGPAHPLRVVLGDLATTATVRRLTVPPLSEQAVLALAAGSALDPGTLYRATAGNAFFVTEVLAAGGDGIPATVRDAVLARAARLSADGRALIEAAAVMGSPVASRLLATVLGGTPEALDGCLASGMLRAQGSTLAFRHAPAQQAVLEAIPAWCQQALHRGVLAAVRGAGWGRAGLCPGRGPAGVVAPGPPSPAPSA